MARIATDATRGKRERTSRGKEKHEGKGEAWSAGRISRPIDRFASSAEQPQRLRLKVRAASFLYLELYLL